MRVLLLGLVLAGGIALAAPRVTTREAHQQVAEPSACPTQGFAGEAMVLPPGHPPIGLTPVPAPALEGLPPGHPPISAYRLQPGQQARPLAPSLDQIFAGPATIDL